MRTRSRRASPSPQAAIRTCRRLCCWACVTAVVRLVGPNDRNAYVISRIEDKEGGQRAQGRRPGGGEENVSQRSFCFQRPLHAHTCVRLSNLPLWVLVTISPKQEY